jgi:hypothetical protein
MTASTLDLSFGSNSLEATSSSKLFSLGRPTPPCLPTNPRPIPLGHLTQKFLQLHRIQTSILSSLAKRDPRGPSPTLTYTCPHAIEELVLTPRKGS